jgi:hypothetical protein
VVPDHERKTGIALHFLEIAGLVKNCRLDFSLFLYLDLGPLSPVDVLKHVLLVSLSNLNQGALLKAT